jgi:hypothetical protein
MIKNFLKDIGAADIDKTESYLVMTAFRSKKLTDEEKQKLGARAREMYLTKNLKKDHKGIFDFESALNKVYELEVPKRALTYNIGTPDEISLPQNALVCYINPNPSKEIDVALDHMKTTLDIVENMIHSGDPQNSKNQLAHHNTDFRSERSKFTRKVWVDFDVDIANIEEIGRKVLAGVIRTAVKTEELCVEPLKKNIFKNPRGFIIQSAGGVHVLVDKNCLCGNPNIFCEELKKWLETGGCKIKEIDFKSGNGYVPLPGCLMMGSHLVTYERI